jgi:hypothetical protein
MALLNREGLLKKQALKIEKVELEGEEFVYVRQMTGRERDAFEQSLMAEKKDKKGNVTYERSLGDFRAKLAVHTICDDKGINQLEPEDYPILSQNMSAARLELIVNRSQELNSISAQDKENLIKNSDAAPSEDSISDSVES